MLKVVLKFCESDVRDFADRFLSSYNTKALTPEITAIWSRDLDALGEVGVRQVAKSNGLDVMAIVEVPG